jgi:hypothetical protein
MAGGKGGRPRKAPQLKLIQGTARPDREPLVPDHVPLGQVIAPADLTSDELRYFGQIAAMLSEQKRSSPHYEPTVTLLARRLAEIEMLAAVLLMEGVTVQSTSAKGVGKNRVVTVMIRARPEVAMKSEAMRHAQSLLNDLMLSPSSALKIAEGKKPDDNPFDEF